MNAVLALVRKDLLRDLKRPWGTIVMLLIPVFLAGLMAAVFGGQAGGGSGGETRITVHVAVVDRDDDFFSGMLRSVAAQGDTAKNLRLHLVDSIDEGVVLLEKRRASALLVFPENMTDNLLDGVPSTIKLIPNPADYVLPRVVEQGTDLLAVALSEAVALVGPELREYIELMKGDEFPPSAVVSQLAFNSTEKMGTVKEYVFPPILEFTAVPADEYVPSASRGVSPLASKECQP